MSFMDRLCHVSDVDRRFAFRLDRIDVGPAQCGQHLIFGTLLVEKVVAIHKGIRHVKRRTLLQLSKDDVRNKLREILESQKKHLSETVAKSDKIDQLHLFNEQEQRQLDSNRRYWAKRLSELDGEMKTEPDRIRSLYEVRAQRVEPVGLVYLWPISR